MLKEHNDPKKRPALIAILKCVGFDHLVRSEVAPLSAPRKSPNNRHPQAPIRHTGLKRVARNISEAPGAHSGLTHTVGPRLPHGPARLLAALVDTADAAVAPPAVDGETYQATGIELPLPIYRPFPDNPTTVPSIPASGQSDDDKKRKRKRKVNPQTATTRSIRSDNMSRCLSTTQGPRRRPGTGVRVGGSGKHLADSRRCAEWHCECAGGRGAPGHDGDIGAAERGD
ncbi:hypothetical protein FN846DRAFT_1014008 [Sphaerosporella brunnea]|uniref:Uncharacterized protein n=1 Tax=Sphaerosporella brunnea TaxID=1250544 RepID=A0A5J5EX64_9PEZI|nr:hypothetical protein FN846DRAFT_1014008 [Sphaerosporella brunnea]